MGSNPACPTNDHQTRPPPDPADARVAAFGRALLAAASVTALLDAWCEARGLPPVVAERVGGPDEAVPPTAAALLGDGPVRFRRVRLCGGGHRLVEAENWFVPDRLPPAMLAALDATDAPFGRVVAPLGCRRHPLGTDLLPPGGRFILEHGAVLRRQDGTAIAVVRERFSRRLLD